MTGKPRGVAFIRYNKREEAQEAISALNNVIPEGSNQPLTVRVAEEHGKQKATLIYNSAMNMNMNMMNSMHYPPPANNTNPCSAQHQHQVNCCKGDMEELKSQLDTEKQKRNNIQSEYAELKQKLDEFSMNVEENKKNPISKYDAAITKQSYFNDTLAKQVCESKEKLKNLSQSLKHIEIAIFI
ncbi:Sex-lethal like, partial [Pseudolycoriella hygida]